MQNFIFKKKMGMFHFSPNALHIQKGLFQLNGKGITVNEKAKMNDWKKLNTKSEVKKKLRKVKY